MSSSTLRTSAEIARIQNYARSVVSLETAEQQFISAIKELFDYIKSLNDFVFQSSGKQHLNAMGLLMVTVGLGQFKSGDLLTTILTEFCERGLVLIPEIWKNNVDHFEKIARSLFPEIPEDIIDQATALIRDPLVRDAVPDIFEAILGICKVVATWECVLVERRGLSGSERSTLDQALKDLEG